MKHMSIDEIVNSRASLDDKSQTQTAGFSQRQKTIVNNAHQRPRDIMSLESKKHETVDSMAFGTPGKDFELGLPPIKDRKSLISVT
jgi:hypothetical protein